MFSASSSGGNAARPRSGRRLEVYRHSLIRLAIPLLAPLSAGAGWSPLSLALGAILMSWDPSPTLAQRFESARAALDAALPRRRRVGRTYQGFVKALTGRSPAILEKTAAHLRTLTRRAAGQQWRLGEFVPIGVDGSRFDAPRTIANEPLGFAGKDRCSPQMTTLLLVHLGSMLPWAWTLGGARRSERDMLRSMLDLLPERPLIVADAGFTGYDALTELHGRGIGFLIRVGSGVRLLRRLGRWTREGKSVVYLWPKSQRSKPPLTLRLIRVGDVHLVTNVTDPRRLSRAAAPELYRRRWGVEVAFRSLKQTLERRKVRSGSAQRARVELNWAITGLWALALTGVRAIAGAGHGPRRLSLAAALAAVRAARAGAVSGDGLRRRLRRAVLDRYERRSAKKSYQWPHKKHPRPPGAPSITTATPAQVQRARTLQSSQPRE